MSEKFDLVRSTKRLKGEFAAFHMDLGRWRRFRSRHKLQWQKVRFEKASQALVPEQRGIYVFSIELASGKLPSHGYMMYVGITGNRSANANLRRRFGQYLDNQRNDTGRKRVRYLLRNWQDDLFFNFVPLPKVGIDLKKIETSFINAVVPPVNRADFEADLAAAIVAAF